MERSHFHRFLLLFGEHEFLRSQRLHFLREVAQQQGEPPPIRPLLDAGLCIMSLRGSSRRAAAAFSRAFWGFCPREGLLLGYCDSVLGSFYLAKIMDLCVWVVKIFLLCCDDVDLNPGCNSWTSFTDAKAALWLLLERRGQLLGGVVRHERHRIDAAGASFCRSWMLPWSGTAKGDWSLAAFARPVPHRAGSLAAFARPEPSAHRGRTQAGPVSATWAGAGYR